MRAGGHFDKVIALVDQMITMLRKEAQSDIEHRDRCQTGTAKNKNDLEDAETVIAKANEALEIAEDKATKTRSFCSFRSDCLRHTGISESKAGARDARFSRQKFALTYSACPWSMHSVFRCEFGVHECEVSLTGGPVM